MDFLCSHWKGICKIYLLTKHYLLLAEELSEDFDTFLQPLKEHRDALDHIIRVYADSNETVNNIEAYRRENMKKALGHMYRAFFDTADWLSYVCRQKIRAILSHYEKGQIVSKYPEYEVTKKALRDFPSRIAEIRGKKDLSDNESILIEEVEEYRKILDEILEIYRIIYDIFA